MHETIVSAGELAQHVSDPAWIIVDCRHSLADLGAGRRLYGEGHIPGAFFAAVESDLAGPKTGKNGRHPMPHHETFGAFLRELGVRPKTQLVAYDAGGDMFAARFWFLCRYIGHRAVAVLDGGFAAWTAANLPVTTEEPVRPRNGTIEAAPRRDLIVNAADVLESIERKHFSLLDARAADRFAGRNETIDPVAGHIPGALNRPFKENFDERGFFRPSDELKHSFAAIERPERLVHQCGSGVSASVNLLAMEIAGLGGSRLYPGSWSEWIADPSRPVSTSP